MQPRFDKRTGSTPYSLVDQARFRAAFDFMRLRADVGEVSEAIAEWWQEFSTADDVRQQDLLEQVRDEQKTRQRVRTRDPVAPKPRGESAARQRQDGQEPAQQDDELETEAAGVSADGEAAAPRKRRRRRKPRTGGGGGAGEGGGSAAGE